MCRFILALLVPLASASAVAADTKFDADSLAKTVAPYLDDRTMIVVHIDVTRLEAKTLVKAAARLSGGKERDFEPIQQRLQTLLPGFREAGGTELYLLVSLTDLEGPFFVAPVKDDGKMLTAFLKGLRSAEKIGAAVVLGPKSTLERLRKLKPVHRPELAKAFAAAGDGAAQVCLLPPAILRRSIEEMLPELPEDWGGGSIKELTGGCQWIAASIEATPAVSARLTMQSPDAGAAKTLRAASVRLLKGLGKSERLRAFVPNTKAAIALATPKLSGDRLTLTRDEKELTTLLQPILAPFAPPPRSDATSKLGKILLAMWVYQGAHKQFPAAASYDKHGKPLLSWRVHLLPHLGEKKLYEEFHLDEPWDSEHNKKLIARMPAAFRSSENAALVKEGKTTFLAPLGDAAMFPDKRGVRLAEVQDGTSQTIFLVDVEDARAVVWTKPEDWRYDPAEPFKGLARRLRDRYIVGMVDGSVTSLQKEISKYTMQALLTRAGGEILGPDF